MRKLSSGWEVGIILIMQCKSWATYLSPRPFWTEATTEGPSALPSRLNYFKEKSYLKHSMDTTSSGGREKIIIFLVQKTSEERDETSIGCNLSK